jgi:parallel beta-helix repeat protein
MLPLINRVIAVEARFETLVWNVDDDGPADFNSIQEAINSAIAGDTIFVHVGIYYEHVIVSKPVTLIGEDSDFTIVDGNKADNVIYIRANNVTVKNFTVRKSGVYPFCGILVENCVSATITNNIVLYNYEGISLLYSFNNVISNNTISNNYHGVYLYSSGSNVISGNTISSNKYHGVYLYSSGSNVISGNTISSNNYDGVYLYSSGSNVISGNTISSNKYHGVNLAPLSDYNTIYHNNFNNTIQVLSQVANFWDHCGEGNYWSDYDKQELIIDGIGDFPYVIDAVNKDNYPLMGMFYNFSITFGKETYSTTIISNSTISMLSFQIGKETGNRMIYFNVIGRGDTTGFCRIMIPTRLMTYPYIVLVNSVEITPTVLNVSDEAHVSLYFTYSHTNGNITIVSSKTLTLYLGLLDVYFKLQADFNDLNVTYHNLLENYSIFLYNYSQLLQSFNSLNNSYRDHLLDYSDQIQNTRNLTYIFAATTALFIMTTIYLSKKSHENIRVKTKLIES